MRKYLSVMRLGWLNAIEYRTDFVVSAFGWGLRILIAYFLWLAVSQARGGATLGNYSFESIMQYFLIVQIISSFTFSRVGFEINQDIVKGDFANFLVKPLNYVLFRICFEVSENLFRTVVGILIFGTVLLLYLGGLHFSILKIPILLLTIAASYFINFCIVSIISFAAFWFTNTSRLLFIYFAILTVLSGIIFPIDLFPPKLFEIAKLLPFPYIFFYPTKIIQSPALDYSVIQILASQVLYSLALGTVLLIVFKAGVKRFEAVGR